MQAEQIAMRGLFGTLNEALSGALAPEWERAFWAAPRHAFLPEKVWVGDDLSACTRSADPSARLHAAYADGPVVTQINDGANPEDGERWPSSSASAPSIVIRMLTMLSVANGHRVLEIGTGTGWNAGLLSHQLGARLVTTVEVDPARKALRRLGKHLGKRDRQ